MDSQGFGVNIFPFLRCGITLTTENIHDNIIKRFKFLFGLRDLLRGQPCQTNQLNNEHQNLLNIQHYGVSFLFCQSSRIIFTCMVAMRTRKTASSTCALSCLAAMRVSKVLLSRSRINFLVSLETLGSSRTGRIAVAAPTYSASTA